MTITTSRIQAGFEPIPGYILRNKLGSGGYGEVWLADAPGGLKKAIKFVLGNIDENRASSELKSLQRVRQVNHPFILSLERIEVVDGQLIIVTELAQGSLHDRLVEFQQKGFVGIMRERLMGYMKDTAEGLDFLCQQHDLQHLDVKPANLLLVADRVKVADFGLIKDIQSNSLSVMGGLTPTYAAPEMFDGRPGRFSDQYSLAIVYQELLTGTLPFRGRTTAQLANEHLNKAPNLEAIPLLERPILSKALAKRPQLRFSDSREFIAALERVHSQAAQHGSNDLHESSQPKKRPSRAQPRSSPLHAPVPSNKIQSSSVSTQSQLPKSAQTRSVEILPKLSDADGSSIVYPDGIDISSSGKHLAIGLGATGVNAVMGMRQRMFENTPEHLDGDQFGFMVIDSDQKNIESVLDLDRKECLPYQSAVLMPLKAPQYYRENAKSDFRQLSRRWLYNIPRSLKTEGVRPLGMLAFLDNADRIFSALRASIVDIARSRGDAKVGEPIEVQIVSSAHGGTGGTIAAEIGFLVRQIAAELDVPMQIEMILTCATPNGFASTDLTTASALACLLEINHYFQTEGLHPQNDQIPESIAVNRPPFDRLSLIYGGQCGNSGDWEEAIAQAAHYLWSTSCTELGPRLARTRLDDKASAHATAEQAWDAWLSTANSRQVEIAAHVEPEDAALRVCLQKSLQWLAAFHDPKLESTDKRKSTEEPDSKLLEKMDFFVGDMFRSNHWTAQAWVRMCMNCIASSEPKKPEESKSATNGVAPYEIAVSDALRETSNTAKPSHAKAPLDVEQRRDLEKVCEQLAMDVENALATMSELISSTQEKLAEWLITRWLTGPQEMMHLQALVRLVGTKFNVNANSLEVVSQKLCEKHDACLERMYSGTQKHAPEHDQELQTLALEARFHSLGAKMLARLAEHMTYLEDLWLNECGMIRSEICTWIDDLAKQLGICLDNSNKSKSFLSALLQTECDDAINKEIRKAFQYVIETRLLNTVLCQPPQPMEGKPNSFHEILDYSTRLMSLPKPSAANTTTQEVGNGHSVEIAKTNTLVPPTQYMELKSGTFSPDKENSVDLAKRSLEFEIDSSRPYFVEFGGAVRTVALVPNELAAQLDPLQKIALEDRQVATIASDRFKETALVCIGERLILADIMERVWMPSTDMWHLANRILARVDVDWVPIHTQNI